MLYYNITGWSFVFITQVVPIPITFSHCWRRDDQLVDTWRHASPYQTWQQPVTQLFKLAIALTV